MFGGNRNESRKVYFKGGVDCEKPSSPGAGAYGLLFDLRKSKGQPTNYVRIAAGHVIRLSYFESGADRSCDVTADMVLEEGESYTLTGGRVYPEGLQVLVSAGACRISVVNDRTNKRVPLLKVDRPNSTPICRTGVSGKEP
ncbi:hypothetical protein [Caldimonas brevitalea]|uniref:Uncharacterized protein n=1 Tax=Caldimonas brevitalea TaxID=413882 RepID=A0A0G3BMQ5_9BURK|nr:hypothetical protein [Caldimonas brevitalea]AKJ30749.1 hypothetical protein AAW51_4058 [Caldimonas brevitalea]